MVRPQATEPSDALMTSAAAVGPRDARSIVPRPISALSGVTALGIFDGRCRRISNGSTRAAAPTWHIYARVREGFPSRRMASPNVPLNMRVSHRLAHFASVRPLNSASPSGTTTALERH